VIRRAWLPAGAALAAGIVHAIAGSHLAAVDPIAALLGQTDVGVVVAAAGVAAARLFLLFVAPGWALHVVMNSRRAQRGFAARSSSRGVRDPSRVPSKSIVRAIYLPPK